MRLSSFPVISVVLTKRETNSIEKKQKLNNTCEAKSDKAKNADEQTNSSRSHFDNHLSSLLFYVLMVGLVVGNDTESQPIYKQYESQHNSNPTYMKIDA